MKRVTRSFVYDKDSFLCTDEFTEITFPVKTFLYSTLIKENEEGNTVQLHHCHLTAEWDEVEELRLKWMGLVIT